MKQREPASTPASAQPVLRPAGPAAPPLDWAANAGAVDDVLREMNARLHGRRRQRLRRAAGAMAALTLLALGGLFLTRDRVPRVPTRPAASLALLPRHETLPDGTTVEFRQDAKIVVAFTPELRRVTLEHGEAHFNVAKNPARPFVVRAGGVDFRAVGTAFTVNLADAKVEMFVTEGKVAVGTAAAPSSDVRPPANDLIVEAGNRVLVAIERAQISTPVVTPVSATQLSQRLAWRAPKLEFSATPLAEAIARINAHAGAGRRPVIRLGDDALRTVRISGILRADNIETLIGVLEADYGIKAERQGDTEIILRRSAQ